MHFSEADLRAAAAAGVLERDRLDPLIAFLNARPVQAPTASASAPAPQFDLAHLLWYAGALIVIGAMGLFSTLAFSQMGGKALTATAIAYAAAFTVAGHYVWHGKGLRVPGGLLIAIAVTMAPLAVYGIQDALGVWDSGARPGSVRDFYIWIKSGWLPMEIAAIVAAALALYFYPFPFIVSVIAVALWFMSMDLTPWIFGPDYNWTMRKTVSMWFGLGVLVLAWIVDRRPRGGDFAFWLHLFGMLAFWGGLTMQNSDSEIGKAVYCLLNVGLMLLAVLLGRRIYAVFGALGISMYLGHLAHRVFADSLLFPFALSLIGVAVIALGLLYHRKQQAVAAWLAANLPVQLAALRPAHARAGP